MNNKGQRVFSPIHFKMTLTAAIALGSSYPGLVLSAPDDANQLRVIEEIVVSARRREESLQDVPVAVSAFGAQQIKERGIATEADIQMSTPGLMVRATNSSNQLNFSLRGQSIDAFSYSAPAVLAYVNEVQAGGVAASAFFDMASLQVLKGPQGTLFGRNATGGAVLYQTQEPEEEFSGYLKATGGSYSNRQIEGAINVPITDSFYARLAGLTRSRDGWQKNRLDGTRLAEIDTDNVRLSLRYAGDKLDNTFVGYGAHHKGRPEGLKIRNAYDIGQTNNGVPLISATGVALYPDGITSSAIFNPADNPGVINAGFTGLQDFLERQEGADFRDVYNDINAKNDIEQALYSNTTSYDISDNVTVKNIIGYNKVESYQPTDIDGSPFMILQNGDESGAFGYQYDTEQMSNEFQVSGTAMDDKLDFIVGLFASKETFRNDIPLKVAADYVTAAEPAPGLFFYDFETEDESRAIFLQGTYAFTESLNFTAGYRHTWEEINIKHLPGDLWGDLFGSQPTSSKFDRPSWGFTLDYRINDENMVYVSQRGSWRAGGFNGVSASPDENGVYRSNSFDSEKTWDIEVGYKFSGYFAGAPMQLNLALYEQTVEDAQRTVYLNVSSITGNVKEAKVSGIELDAKFNPTDWLELGAAYAYTDAKFTDGRGNIPGFELEFGPYGDTPETTVSLYFLTSLDTSLGEFTLRGDYYQASEAYFSSLSDTIIPDTELDSYQLLNFRVALNEISGSSVSAVAFVRNATDEEYERGGLPLGATIGTNATIVGEPRTVGFELTYDF